MYIHPLKIANIFGTFSSRTLKEHFFLIYQKEKRIKRNDSSSTSELCCIHLLLDLRYVTLMVFIHCATYRAMCSFYTLIIQLIICVWKGFLHVIVINDNLIISGFRFENVESGGVFITCPLCLRVGWLSRFAKDWYSVARIGLRNNGY